ncbi:hypothetical protein G5B37_00655 [Rasiella rasia]|uniref:Uncharacterized protein n=1 Tax=Rasiella rasia TaxID=2744027 RepID=A0A6G6GHR2_9FLAO|nr:hypothetical protein [Rasiella rasia]QIE58126.1 hypothetical protein G5B37_00655 [Rasiella rasia]
MDVLDTLKKEWQNKEQKFPKLSYNDIYSMLLKKSSSMVKWIFIISICELLLWILISIFLFPESSKQFTEAMGLKTFMLISSTVSYVVVAIFIYLFYRNYKTIQVTSTVKQLMESILKTRKTVRYFVYFNIGISALGLIAMNIYLYFNQEQLANVLSSTQEYGAIPAENLTHVFFIAQLIVGTIFIGLLMLFYYLIYGLMLRRLKHNYRELKKIEL